jgi:hypothetical protein
MTTSPHRLLKVLRQLHLYIGVFTAPALLFFAFTGALQTFSLHETTRGSSYQPPQWAVVLGQIHKKQTPVVAPKRPPQPAEASHSKPQPVEPPHDAAPQMPTRTHHSLPMKIFFLIVAIGLAISSLSGIYMSYKYVRNKAIVTTLLLLGVVIPLVLVFI